MFTSLNFFEEENLPKNIHIGFRTIKTVVAVFICGIIGFFRGEPPFFAMFSAVICMQNSTEESLLSAINRVLGTIVGGLFGVALRCAGEAMGFYEIEPVYYLLMAIFHIPIILLMLYMKKPSVVALACVVFISVSLTTGNNVLDGGIQRILDTLIGIVTALIVNIALPNSRKKHKKEYVENTIDEVWENIEYIKSNTTNDINTEICSDLEDPVDAEINTSDNLMEAGDGLNLSDQADDDILTEVKDDE